MTKAKLNPNYYTIIPAGVRYDQNLPAQAKLLYGEIASLTNQEGFCWAGNKYFADLYGITAKRVSELIVALENCGHVIIEIDKAGGNSRYIYLAEAIRKNTDRVSVKKRIAIRKNTEHNNKTNIKENSISSDETSSPEADATSKEAREAYELYLKCFKAPTFTSEGLSIEDAMLKAEKRYKLTPKRLKAIKTRLKDAGLIMLKAAIIGYARQKNFEGRRHWAGDNDNGWIADLEEFICRNYEQVEKGANFYEAQKKAGKNTNDPWA